MSKPQYRLLSTNTVPERSRRVIAEIIEQFKDRYELTHVGNSDSIENVRATVERERPDVIFISSGWTAEQEEEISRIAKEVIPNIKIFSPPRGLHAAESSSDACGGVGRARALVVGDSVGVVLSEK
ncbi:hypothetical protein C8R46DRAFT_1215313 [Mycena filopes]|nr:hypothetical protein C8R46DRAFT_1215313 [Mycena filopes]